MQKRSDATNERTGSGDKEVEETFEEMYERVVMTCFRYLDFKSLDQVNNITPYEYRLLMKSKELKIVDKPVSYTHLRAHET